MSDNINTVTDSSFEEDVLKSSIPVLVDFWASWCAPCRAIAPVVDELSVEYSGKIKFAKINVDENPATPGTYGIRGIPALLLFKNGRVIDQIVGAVPKSTIVTLLSKAS